MSGGFLVLVSAGVGMKERPRAITGEPPAAVSTCHFSIIVNAHCTSLPDPLTQ